MSSNIIYDDEIKIKYLKDSRVLINSSGMNLYLPNSRIIDNNIDIDFLIKYNK